MRVNNIIHSDSYVNSKIWAKEKADELKHMQAAITLYIINLCVGYYYLDVNENSAFHNIQSFRLSTTHTHSLYPQGLSISRL